MKVKGGGEGEPEFAPQTRETKYPRFRWSFLGKGSQKKSERGGEEKKAFFGPSGRLKNCAVEETEIDTSECSHKGGRMDFFFRRTFIIDLRDFLGRLAAKNAYRRKEKRARKTTEKKAKSGISGK